MRQELHEVKADQKKNCQHQHAADYQFIAHFSTLCLARIGLFMIPDKTSHTAFSESVVITGTLVSHKSEQQIRHW